MKHYFEGMRRYIMNDIGIDLGTVNTLVYVRGKGITIHEPTVVAINRKTGQVVAVGQAAKAMLGRTPAHISAVRPLVGGVISDFEVTEEMIAYLLRRAEADNKKLLGPRVLVGVPSGITNVETRAVRDATMGNGAREVFIIEEPMAAAIGIRLPVREPGGNFIIDVGGGTTDIAVISLGGVVRSRGIKIAGDRFNEDIIAYLKNEFKLLIGEKTAEDLKITIGRITTGGDALEVPVKGRDLVTGLPRETVLSDGDIREAILPSVDSMLESIKEVLEITPPELLSDVMRRGVHLVGGGALLRGLDSVISEFLKIPVHVASDPLTAVARGTGIVLENLSDWSEVLIENEDELPPKDV